MKPKTTFRTVKGDYVVLENDGPRIVVCAVSRDSNRHRADHELSYADADASGMDMRLPVRCVPFTMRLPNSFMILGAMPDATFAKMKKAATDEALRRNAERIGYKRVSSVYRW